MKQQYILGKYTRVVVREEMLFSVLVQNSSLSMIRNFGII